MAAARQAIDSEFDRLLAQMAHSGGATGRAVLAELGTTWLRAGAVAAGAATSSVSVSPSASASASPSPSPSPRTLARQRRARAAPRSADVSVASAGRKRTPGGPARGGNRAAASEGQQRRVRRRRAADARAPSDSSGSDEFVTAAVAAAHKLGAASVQSLPANAAQESTALPSRSTTPSTPREGSGSDDADWGDDVMKNVK